MSCWHDTVRSLVFTKTTHLRSNFSHLIRYLGLSERTSLTLDVLSKLRDARFDINLDDFGVGYSSLSMLLDATVDTIKIDKHFIDLSLVSPRDRAYIKQMCILLNITDKRIIFEGIETESQATFVAECGIDIVQGWLFDKALSLNEFMQKYM